MAVWSIFFVKKWSEKVFFVFILLVFSKLLYLFYQTGDKVILLGAFFHLFISFLLYLLWKEELKSSVFNPNFYSNQLYKKDRYNFKVTVCDQAGKIHSGFLTNWDEYSCFLSLDENSKKNIRGLVKISMKFLGREFQAAGHIMTWYANGFGIRFEKKVKKNHETILNWKDFYAIIIDRGILKKER